MGARKKTNKKEVGIAKRTQGQKELKSRHEKKKGIATAQSLNGFFPLYILVNV